MEKMVIVGKKKKGKKFFGGNLQAGMTWNVSEEYDKLTAHNFIRTARINNLRKKRSFQDADSYITLNEYCHRLRLRLTEIDKRKILKYLDAKQIWINWEHHLEDTARSEYGNG